MIKIILISIVLLSNATASFCCIDISGNWQGNCVTWKKDGSSKKEDSFEIQQKGCNEIVFIKKIGNAQVSTAYKIDQTYSNFYYSKSNYFGLLQGSVAQWNSPNTILTIIEQRDHKTDPWWQNFAIDSSYERTTYELNTDGKELKSNGTMWSIKSDSIVSEDEWIFKKSVTSTKCSYQAQH